MESSLNLSSTIKALNNQNVWFDATWIQTTLKNFHIDIGHSPYVIISALDPKEFTNEMPDISLILRKCDDGSWMLIETNVDVQPISDSEEEKVKCAHTKETPFDLNEYFTSLQGNSTFDLIMGYLTSKHLWVKVINLFKEMREIIKMNSDKGIFFERTWRKTSRLSFEKDLAGSDIVLVEIDEKPDKANPHHFFCLERVDGNWLVHHPWKEHAYQEFDMQKFLNIDDTNEYFGPNPNDWLWIKSKDYSPYILKNHDIIEQWLEVTMEEAMKFYDEFLISVHHSKDAIYSGCYIKKEGDDFKIVEVYGLYMQKGDVFNHITTFDYDFFKHPHRIFHIRPKNLLEEIEKEELHLFGYQLWTDELSLKEAMEISDCVKVGIHHNDTTFTNLTKGFILVEKDLRWTVTKSWGLPLDAQSTLDDVEAILKINRYCLKRRNVTGEANDLKLTSDWHHYPPQLNSLLDHLDYWKIGMIVLGYTRPSLESGFVVDKSSGAWKVTHVFGKMFPKDLNLENQKEFEEKYFDNFGFKCFYYKTKACGFYIAETRKDGLRIFKKGVYGPYPEKMALDNMDTYAKNKPDYSYEIFEKKDE